MEWVNVYLDWVAKNPGNTDCVSLFNTAAEGLLVAHASEGVWWENLPDTIPNTITYGTVRFRGLATKMMVDATKSSPVAGVPGTVTHEAAHASRKPKYATDDKRKLRNIIHPMMDSEVGKCVPLLGSLPVIPTSN